MIGVCDHILSAQLGEKIVAVFDSMSVCELFGFDQS